jgi:hypothetical protein
VSKIKLEEAKSTFLASLDHSSTDPDPYKHWLMTDVFPESVLNGILNLPFSAPRLDYSVGARAEHNDKRGYFDQERIGNYPACEVVARTLQDSEVVKAIESKCNVDLKGTNLRIEFAQDTDGFWLAPHTDIGVKKFTMLIYLSKDSDSKNWGTSVYTGDKPEDFVFNSPYISNGAFIFVPSDKTWHGYEKREMHGIRKSLIVNYVTAEWKARHELAFPDSPV